MAQTRTLPGEQQLPAVVDMLQKPDMLEQVKRALPRHLTPDRFARMVLTSLRKTPKLALCDQRSFLSAMMELAQLGLEPDTPLGHAWMLPYGTTAQIIIGYKGMIALAERGSRITMNAEVVYEGDEFDYSLGTEAFIHHKPTDDLAKRGEIIYAYSVARFPDGRPAHFKLINRADIEEARQASPAWQRGQRDKTKRDSPWYTRPAAQARKTAIRRHASFLPLSAELARVVELDDQIEAGKQQAFLPEGFDVPRLPPAQTAEELERRTVEAKPAVTAEDGDSPADGAR